MSTDGDTPADRLDALRELCAPLVDAGSAQRLYEHWLREDAWSIETQALPLLVGVDPAGWDGHLRDAQVAGHAAAVATTLARVDGVSRGAIRPDALRRWARENGRDVPAALGNLLDFIARVLPVAESAPATTETTHAGERERVLGAALALVTKSPDRCRDANGFFDGAAIVEAIFEKAVLWFPDRPPTMTREEMAEVIERYLT